MCAWMGGSYCAGGMRHRRRGATKHYVIVHNVLLLQTQYFSKRTLSIYDDNISIKRLQLNCFGFHVIEHATTFYIQFYYTIHVNGE